MTAYMFRALKDKLFWRSQFDEIWRSVTPGLGSIASGQKLYEKKFVWREDKGRNFSPRLAVFKACEEFCDEYYRDNHRHLKSEDDFEAMGWALKSAAPYLDEEGHYKAQESFLSPKWLAYANKWRAKSDLRIAEQERKAREVASYRFDLEQLDAAWEDLKIGEVPKEASAIWLHSWPRQSAHEIAEKSSVGLKDFVFWMCVFKRHLYYSEQVVAGTQMYIRQQDDNSLSSVISNKLQREASASTKMAE